jgi:hypothetical protein
MITAKEARDIVKQNKEKDFYEKEVQFFLSFLCLKIEEACKQGRTSCSFDRFWPSEVIARGIEKLIDYGYKVEHSRFSWSYTVKW